MSERRTSWLTRAIVAADDYDTRDFDSLYQELLDAAFDESGCRDAAGDIAAKIIMRLLHVALMRRQMTVEFDLHLMAQGDTVDDAEPEEYTVSIDPAQGCHVGSDVDDGEAYFWVRHRDDWAMSRPPEAAPSNRWPPEYWRLPADLPESPVVKLHGFHFGTLGAFRDRATPPPE